MRTRALLVCAMAGMLIAAAKDPSRLEGWVTKFDPATQVIEVNGETISLRGMKAVGGGRLATGVFVSVDRGRMVRVKPQQLPAEEQVSRFPAKQKENPGRTEFSHVRHFNALGQKECKTCHSDEMGLGISSTYASRVADPALEAHAQSSLGRFCTACHNGTTLLAEVGTLRQRMDVPIFTAAKTGDSRSCERCHIPADHGSDFTPKHGGLVERSGVRACGPCHATDWTARDQQQHANLQAAEKALKINADDARAAGAVGPNNFCVYCHRTENEWRQ